MSKKQDFINYVEEKLDVNEMPTDIALYWDTFKGKNEEKPLFTDNGKLILQYLKDNLDTPMWKARDIAEGLFISSRTVSGAMRKLVSDGFVEKIGENPAIYEITEAGKTVEII